jgi:hypothetical protein
MWQSLATFGFSSINLGITILGGYFIGVLLEKSYHWGNMPLIGVFIGLALGLMELFIIAFKAGTKK